MILLLNARHINSLLGSQAMQSQISGIAKTIEEANHKHKLACRFIASVFSSSFCIDYYTVFAVRACCCIRLCQVLCSVGVAISLWLYMLYVYGLEPTTQSWHTGTACIPMTINYLYDHNWLALYNPNLVPSAKLNVCIIIHDLILHSAALHNYT